MSVFRYPRLPPPRDARYFYLLLTLIALILALPILEDEIWGGPIIGAFGAASMILGLHALALERHTLIVASVLAIISYAGNVFCFYSHMGLLAAQPLQLAFYAYLTLSLLRSVLETDKVTPDTVCGGISVYLLLGICWAIVYGIIEYVSPGSIREANAYGHDNMDSALDYLYFSYVTLTTLGYGDIVPVGKPARLAVMLEAIVGLLFIAVFIGRLVSMTSLPGPRKNKPHGKNTL